LFAQSKLGSQIIHGLNQLQNLVSNVDNSVKHKPSFDFQSTYFTSTATQTIPYPLISSLQIVNPPVVAAPLNISSTTNLDLNPPPPPQVMATQYAPLVLPQNLGAMPID